MTEAEARNRAHKLEWILRDLFEVVENTILILRFILYVGSAAGAWFYLRDRPLAVAIVASLTTAHVLMAVKEYIRDKKKEICE